MVQDVRIYDNVTPRCLSVYMRVMCRLQEKHERRGLNHRYYDKNGWVEWVT